MNQDQNRFSSVLVTTDPALKTALSYLFSVILKYDFDVIEDFTAEGQNAALAFGPQALFVYPPKVKEEAVAFIVRIKEMANPPVVIVLQNGVSEFGAQAFLAGADDVVDWPCSLHELALRLFVRLGQSPSSSSASVQDANWETEAYIAARAGLTTAEAQVMRVLFSHDGQIVTRDDLSYAVDARPWRYGDRKFDVHVAKIRKKLLESFGPQMSVSTVRSSGYCLSTNGADLFSES